MEVSLRICLTIIALLVVGYGIKFACSTFRSKGKVFYAVVVALVAAFLQELLINIRDSFVPGSASFIVVIVLSGIIYFYLFIVVNLLYVIRIKSLGSYITIEWFAKYTPALFGTVAVAIYIIFVLFYMNPTIMSQQVYIGITIGLFTAAMLLEIYLSAVLIKKIVIMLEYRESVQRKAILKTKVYLVLIILMELSIFFIRIFYFHKESPESHLRTAGFILRIIVVIDFYKDIITDIVTMNMEERAIKDFFSRDSALERSYEETLNRV